MRRQPRRIIFIDIKIGLETETNSLLAVNYFLGDIEIFSTFFAAEWISADWVDFDILLERKC